MRGDMTRVELRDNQLGEIERKSVTFSNTTGTVSLFTVTGRVVVRIAPICTTGLASAGGCNMELGTSFDVDAMITSTDVTTVAAEEIWIDATPDSKIEPLSAIREYIISDSDDVILTLSAQVDSGVLDFYCFWFPLSEDGEVVPA